MMNFFRQWLALSVLVGCIGSARAGEPAAANKPAASPAKSDRETVLSLTVHPARPPQPALKYCLLPEFIDRVNEDAAPLYLKAMLLLCEGKTSKEDLEKVATWADPQTTPLEKIPQQEAEELLKKFSSALSETTIAARRSRCDWGLPIHETSNIFAILLPEAGQSRQLARLVTLKARLALRAGKLDEAVAALRTGYALGRHVAEAPLLINGLVGLNIVGMCNSVLEEALQQPATPNLYWSLVALPQPLIDLRPAFEGESACVQLLFPDVYRALKSRSLSAAEWQSLLTREMARFAELTAGTDSQSGAASTIWKGLAVGAALAAMEPVARQALIAAGHSPKELEAMPPAQIVLMRVFESYEQQRDNLFKLMGLPHWQAAPLLQQAEVDLQRSAHSNGFPPDPGVLLPSLVLPAVGKCHFTQARGERHLAALRCVEALRFYAAEHDGALPARLDDVREVPLPLNPVTGQAFRYRLEGKTAILRADGGPDYDQPREYRITVAAAKR